MNRFLVTKSINPYYNLALEDLLFERRLDGATLYLWQNERTVVIGRNQNAWRECRTELLQAEGGRLMRRTSGGGAVFHDLGNLNFTFLLPRAEYDLTKQLSVVREACRSFGISTAFTGRNDLIIEPTGEKFSGNAFRFSETYALHHGTILIGADMERLTRYLAPSKHKLASKGISSVKSRVKNLSECAGGISIERMILALSEAYSTLYGPFETLDEQSLHQDELQTRVARFASWEWNYGISPAFDISFEKRFAWGEIELLFKVEKGVVKDVHCFTDAMDATLAERIAPLLQGETFQSRAISRRLMSLGGDEGADLASWMAGEAF